MVILTMAENGKLEVMQRVMDGRLSIGDAGKLLGRTCRTIFRLLAKVRLRGSSGVIHGNRGNGHAKAYDEELRAKIITLARDKYKGFNDLHFREQLAKNEGIKIGREALRLLLRSHGIESKKKRRKRKFRSRRDRKEAFGMMIQADASNHDWLEGRGPRMTLVGGVDDATGHIWCAFERSESTWGYFRMMRDIAMDKGIPVSLYTDRHTIFHSTKEASIMDQLENKKYLTQFGRAMNELGVRLIKAWSPQAKGRIERVWNTFQDRLIAEMRVANICDMSSANAFLKAFLADYNNRFSVQPRNRESTFRKRPDVRTLDRMLCIKETRSVANDHTIQFEGVVLQIPPSSKWASIAGRKVTVLQLKDGAIEIHYKQYIVARFEYEKVERIIKNCGFKDDHVLLAA